MKPEFENYIEAPVDVDGVAWKTSDTSFYDEDGTCHKLDYLRYSRLTKSWQLGAGLNLFQANSCRHVENDSVKGTTMGEATEKAVKQLKDYGRYIVDNAENIVGNIDNPTWVTEGGIRMAFTLLKHESVPILEVSHEYIVTEEAGR